MKYVHILLISCLLLCSCSFEEEAEPENNALSSSSTAVVPSSSSVEPTEPSILDCPLEDINITKYYPDPEFDPPLPPDPDNVPLGYCRPSRLELSAEELSFSSQGGVRCITARNSWVIGASSGNDWSNCNIERILRFPDGSTFIGTRQEFKDFFGDRVGDNWGASKFKRLVCPWFTATDVDIWTEGRHTLHISVNQNETGNERETSVVMTLGNCGGGFKITQSPK